MMDTGIWDRLKVEKGARRIRLRRERGKKNQKKQGQWRKPDGVSSLEGGLVTLFILCGSLVLLGLSCFVLECRHLVWKGIRKTGMHIKKCWNGITFKWKNRKYRRIHVKSLERKEMGQSMFVKRLLEDNLGKHEPSKFDFKVKEIDEDK
jgi:hypothetical protein